VTIQWPLDKVKVTGEWANSPDFYAQFGQRGHNGIDLAAGVGTPVYATDAGTVVAEGWGSNDSWMGSIAGIYVRIQHSWGYSAYAHLSRTIVDAGQRVKRGQLIGFSGATGVGTGPHLHFETFPSNPNFGNGFAGRVNPRTWGLVARGSSNASKPVSPAPKPKIQEDDMGYYVQTSVQGTKYYVSAATGKKRAIPSKEWSRLRSAQGAGLTVALITISAADLNAIPNA
jgi:murein DD-endopeptidase MepM/ murein hydrolase activator NlpD